MSLLEELEEVGVALGLTAEEVRAALGREGGSSGSSSGSSSLRDEVLAEDKMGKTK